jgi:DNA-binding MarR family transcriptional regulator
MTNVDSTSGDIVASLGHLTLGSRLKRLGERLQGETTRFIQAQGIDLPSSWFPLLAALDRGEATVGELAEALGVSQPGVTRSVANLAGIGLVQVATGDADRRRRTVRLTGEGAALVGRARRELWPRIDAAVAEACAGLEGSLLEQVGVLERRLDEVPIDRRAAAVATVPPVPPAPMAPVTAGSRP